MTTVSTEIVQLGQEARNHALQVLGWGKTLSRLLADQFGGQAGGQAGGRLFTSLPSPPPPAAQTQFERGGLFGEAGSPVPWRKGEFLHDRIEAFLREEPSGLCLLEDYLAAPTDPVMKLSTSRWVAHEQEVYQLLLPGDDAAAIEAAFAQAYAPPIFCGVLSRAAGRLADTEALSEERLEEIADGATLLFVAAYDGEGLVYWER